MIYLNIAQDLLHDIKRGEFAQPWCSMGTESESGRDPHAGACTKGSYDITHICQLSQQVLSVLHYAGIVHRFSLDNRVNKSSLTHSYVTI